MLDIDCLFMWGATVALPLWRAIIAFRVCGSPTRKSGSIEFDGA
jgi:hypothetical protein